MMAHSTRYAGVNFRSRLEAKWAAFFDLAEWRWEYETPDEVGWTPDFLLIGAKQTVKVLNSAADDSRSTTSGSSRSALTISTSRPIAKRATA